MKLIPALVVPVSLILQVSDCVYENEVHLDSTLSYKLRFFSKISVSHSLKMHFLKCLVPLYFRIQAIAIDDHAKDGGPEAVQP